MSFNGIQQFAAMLSIVQGTRQELLRGDNQDIRLGQLLDDAKDCVKERFAEETLIDSEIDSETANLSMKAIDDLEGE